MTFAHETHTLNTFLKPLFQDLNSTSKNVMYGLCHICTVNIEKKK